MTILESLILGLIQGVGEFLPISSSAHLALFSYFLDKEYQGLQFDVMLHLGTLFAIILFFFKDWLKIFSDAVKNPKTQEGKLLWFLIAATFPAAIAGLLLEKYAETVFRHPLFMATALIIFSILILVIDHKAKEEKETAGLSLKDALIIGFAQVLALIPGASRSGVTIAAAIMLKYKRFDSAKISFLLATPIIFAAGIMEGRKLCLAQIDTSLTVAFISSFFFGIISIKFLLQYLKKNNLTPFMLYRIVLGFAVFFKFFWAK